MQMWTILKTTSMIGSTMIILSMMTMVWNTHGVQKGERRDRGFQGQVSTQSPQSQTIPYCYNPQSPMMKHPS